MKAKLKPKKITSKYHELSKELKTMALADCLRIGYKPQEIERLEFEVKDGMISSVIDGQFSRI